MKTKTKPFWAVYLVLLALLMTNCATVGEPDGLPDKSRAYAKEAFKELEGNPAPTTQNDELPLVLREATTYFNTRIVERSKIAVVSIQSGSGMLSDYIIDELTACIVNDRKHSVIDRQRLDELRAEQTFQFSGEVDELSASEIGKFLGAGTIITGTLTDLEGVYSLRLKAIDVQTAQVEGQFNRIITSSQTASTLLRIGNRGATTSNASQQTGQSSQSTTGANISFPQQTRQPQQTQTQAPTGAKPGTYTYWPRLRSTRAGLPLNNVFIPKITVTKDFIVIHFCRNASGALLEDGETGVSAFYYPENFTLQNLDNPSQFFSPVDALNHSNGMGRLWAISYKYFPATRLKLTGLQYGGEQPFVFEEIIIGEPDQ